MEDTKFKTWVWNLNNIRLIEVHRKGSLLVEKDKTSDAIKKLGIIEREILYRMTQTERGREK